jgi:hypothetical protein
MLAAALAALAIGGAQASTIYIGGASAFRKTAFDALTQSGWSVKATDQSSTSDLSKNGATRVLLTNASGDYISTCWSGSEAGVQSALAGTNSRPLTFLPTNATGPNLTNAASLASFGGYVSTNADAALTDNSSVISRWNGTQNSVETVNGQTVVVNYKTPAAEQFVGVQAFTWMASPDFPTSVKSISGNAAQALLKNGRIPLSLLSGSSADTNKFVWLFGRNPDSGTRLTTFNEVGYGALSAAKQYYATNNANNKITDIKLTPAAVINGLNVVEGDNGESSGGTLAGKIAPMASTISVSYSTYTTTNQSTNVSVVSTNVTTNRVVTTNSYDSYVPVTTSAPNLVTNVATSLVWTNVASSNKVIISTAKYTNPAKTPGDTIVKYKLASKIKGAAYESSIFALSVTNVANTGTPVKPKMVTNITPAVFDVTEYYYNTNAWSQVPVSSTNVTTNGTKSVVSYVSTNVPYTVTNLVISTNVVTNSVSTNVTVVTATSTATTNIVADANYAITYCSVADALTTNTVSAEYPVLLNYNNDGVAGSMAVSADRDAAKANIATKIKNGSYSFYNVESAVLSPDAQSGAAALFTNIVTAIPSKVAAPNVKLSDMNTTRASDGAVIYAK